MSTGWYCGSEFRNAMGLARAADLRPAPFRFACRLRCVLLAIRSPRSEWHAVCAPRCYCPALCNLEYTYDTADTLAGSSVVRKTLDCCENITVPHPQKMHSP